VGLRRRRLKIVERGGTHHSQAVNGKKRSKRRSKKRPRGSAGLG